MYGLFLSTLAVVFVIAFWLSLFIGDLRSVGGDPVPAALFATILTTILVGLAYVSSEFIAFSMMASMMLPS